MENVPLLFLASWDIIKHSSSTCDGLLSSDARKRVVDTTGGFHLTHRHASEKIKSSTIQ